jgi:hypothetical protein
MNTIIDTLANLTAVPMTSLRTATNALPNFSYIQVPHIKLKAEHQALVLFHIVKVGLAYWEGWRDGRKNGNAEEAEDQREEKKWTKMRYPKRRERRNKLARRGVYTVVYH